jgi:AcrR family transcriptional regulator
MARPRTDIAPRIVRAARKRFLEEGVDGASLRTIARDAKTNVGMIYYYFPAKDDLFLAIVEEKYGALLLELEQCLATEGTTRDRLRKVFTRLGALSPEELDVVRLIVREALVSSTRLDRLLERFSRGHLPMLIAAIADGMQRGELIDDVPAPLLTIAVLGVGVLPQIFRRVAGERAPVFANLPSGDALAELLLDVVYDGVGKARRRVRKS